MKTSNMSHSILKPKNTINYVPNLWLMIMMMRLKDKDKIFYSIQESLNDKFEIIHLGKSPSH